MQKRAETGGKSENASWSKKGKARWMRGVSPPGDLKILRVARQRTCDLMNLA